MKLNVLVACESSGVVREAFRALGHNAWSCDLLPCDGDPLYHIKSDVFAVLNRGSTQGKGRLPNYWDLMIAHPPCTYLCNSGVRWLHQKDDSQPGGWDVDANNARWDAMIRGAEFFANLYAAKIPYIAVENPIMHRHAAVAITKFLCDLGVLKLPARRIKATQYVQPWMFGHAECKATGLYLRNLPKLEYAALVPKEERKQSCWRTPPGPNRWKIRSKTYEGIAKAMASQWSAHIIAEKQKKTNK